MKDNVAKGTGNSRFLKSAISSSTTWEQFRAMLMAGNLPIDVNGINPAGWQVLGDTLSKANLLPDEVATALGLTINNPQVKDALMAVNKPRKIATFETAGAFTWTAPDLNGGKPYQIGVFIMGGGSSGSCASYYSSSWMYATGGGSGFSTYAILTVTPFLSKNIVVGRGGASAIHTIVSGKSCLDGNAGGSSSFDGLVANGGGIGDSGAGAKDCRGAIPGGTGDGIFGQRIYDAELFSGKMQPFQCINPFDFTQVFGSGGGGTANFDTASVSLGGKNAEGLGGGNASKTLVSGVVRGEDASLPGCGGGAAVVAPYSVGHVLKSGAGADGAVYIYYMGETA